MIIKVQMLGDGPFFFLLNIRVVQKFIGYCEDLLYALMFESSISESQHYCYFELEIPCHEGLPGTV